MASSRAWACRRARSAGGWVLSHCRKAPHAGQFALRACANRVKILFTKMGSEGYLIGSANSILINPSLLMA